MAHVPNPTKYWLNKFKLHSHKLAKYTSHVTFLSNCLQMGIPPNGLTIPLPLSGLPTSTHDSYRLFRFQISLQFTHLTLNNYIQIKDFHLTNLLSLYKILSLTSPNFLDLIEPIIQSATELLTQHTNNHLKKLSSLYTTYLNNGVSLPTSFATKPNIKTNNTPLDLQTQLNLPPPPPGPPIFPRRQPQNHNHQPPTQQANTNTDTETEVINLSSRTLSTPEISVLSKGLSFAPTPTVDHFALMSDVVTFCKNLRWKVFWSTHPAQILGPSTTLHPALQKFQPPSDKEPPPLPQNHPVEIYISQLLSKVSDPSFINNLKPTPNLTPEERQALKNLKNDRSIVITPADKGSSTVIMNLRDYREEALNQLNNSSFYKKLREDPNPRFHLEIKQFLQKNATKENLSAKDINLLSKPNPRTPTFYILPKIHKPGNPGRPIVSSYGSPTEMISAFIDQHLQPIVTGLPSFVKDSYHFLELLQSVSLPTNSTHPILMVTIDVTSLYTNIPHAEGLKALETYLQKRAPPHTPSTPFLVKLAEMVLTKNCFVFEDEYYLQVQGTAMGTRMAPSYANIFMAALEEHFLSTQSKKPLLWKRYIDDIFLLWEHGEESLNSFLTALNSTYSVKFTHSYSPSTISYLDLNIEILNNSFHSSIHIKPTNKLQYLQFNSCHPYHVKRSIPYSLSVRAHRLCNNPQDLSNHLSLLKSSLSKRGYPKNILDKQIIPANAKHNPKQRTPQDTFRLFTTYFPGIHKIKHILKEIQPILSSNPATKDLLPTNPAITYRRAPTLNNILTRKSLRNPPDHSAQNGLSSCKRPRCKTCPIIDPSTTFTTPNCPNTYPIRTPNDCTSSNVVYKLACNFCPSFYVGETTTMLSLRINNHRSSTKQCLDYPVATHAKKHNKGFDECFTVQILQNFGVSTPSRKLKNSELAHIWLLGSYREPGLNIQK